MELKQLEPDITLLELSGRLVLGRESQSIEWKIENLLEQGHKKIILDLANVSYVDSTGVGILVGCTGKAKEAGGRLRIAGTVDPVMDILTMTEVHRVLSLDSTTSAACAALGAA